MTYLTELTDNELLRSIWAALKRMEEALGQPIIVPAPVVEPPDLGDIVTAVLSLNGTGPTADDIAQAIAEALHFPTPEPDVSLAKVAEALEKLSHQLKGVGGNQAAFGGGSVSFAPGQVDILADAISTQSVRTEVRLDYAGRTDGQPVYIGHADNGTATSGAWVVEKMSYGMDGYPTRKQVLAGAWDDRASLNW